MNVNAFLLSEILQTKSFSLPLKKVHLTTMSPFLCNTPKKQKNVPACARAGAQCVVCVAEKRFSLGEWVVPSPRVAKRAPSFSTPTDFGWLRKRTSIRRSRFDPGLALKTLSHRKRCASRSHKVYKMAISVLPSVAKRERDSAKPSRRGKGQNRSAFSAEILPTVERAQSKGPKLKHRKFADSVPHSRPPEHKSSRYRGSLAASAAFKRDS